MVKKGKEELLEIMNMRWKKKDVSEVWKTGIILPLNKEEDNMDCSNYKGITLLCVAFNIYERILEASLRFVVEPRMADVQSSF